MQSLDIPCDSPVALRKPCMTVFVKCCRFEIIFFFSAAAQMLVDQVRYPNPVSSSIPSALDL